MYNIYEDRARTLWVLLGDSRVLNYNRENNKLIPNSFFEDNKTHFHEMLEDRNGLLWFGAHSVVVQLNRSINKTKK